MGVRFSLSVVKKAPKGNLLGECWSVEGKSGHLETSDEHTALYFMDSSLEEGKFIHDILGDKYGGKNIYLQAYSENEACEKIVFDPVEVKNYLEDIKKIISERKDEVPNGTYLLVGGKKADRFDGFIENYRIGFGDSFTGLIFWPLLEDEITEENLDEMREKLYDEALDGAKVMMNIYGDEWPSPKKEEYMRMTIKSVKYHIGNSLSTDKKYQNTPKLKKIKDNPIKIKELIAYKDLDKEGNPINEVKIIEKRVPYDPKEHIKVFDLLIEVCDYAIENKLYVKSFFG